jgi:hypothetical protein
MNKLRDDEVRRLVSHLRPLVSAEELARIEDILRSDEGPDYLLTDALLAYFLLLNIELKIDDVYGRCAFFPMLISGWFNAASQHTT